MQLFLLHFAGGNTYSYDFLIRKMRMITNGIDFFSLELPGRGKRHDEALITDKENAVADYISQIERKRNGMPYLIYGHSMGATLGLSVAKEMEKLADAPNALIVSGNPGPGVKEMDGKGLRYLMSDEDFKTELKNLGGIPDEILSNKELFDFFNPIMRADFEVLEKYEGFEKGILLNTPIYALMGDEEKDYDRIDNWDQFTTAYFRYEILKGNHFFIHDHPDTLAKIIKEAILHIPLKKCYV